MPDDTTGRPSPTLEQLRGTRSKIYDENPLIAEAYHRAALTLLLDIEIHRLELAEIRGAEDYLLVDCLIERSNPPRVGEYSIRLTHKPSGVSVGGNGVYEALRKLVNELKWRETDGQAATQAQP